jgi:hypothetical protein
MIFVEKSKVFLSLPPPTLWNDITIILKKKEKRKKDDYFILG